MPVPSGTNKDLRRLADLAEFQGWTVQVGDNNHLKWYKPNGEPLLDGSPFYVTSKTPSDSNIINTIKNQPRREGLYLSRAEYRRAMRTAQEEPTAVELVEKTDGSEFRLPNHPDDTPHILKLTAERAREMTDVQLVRMFREVGMEVETMSGERLANMMNLFRTFDDNYTTCLCGKTFVAQIGLFTHCDKHFDEGGHYPVNVDGTAPASPLTLPPEPAPEAQEAPETPAPITHPEDETRLSDEIKLWPEGATFVILSLACNPGDDNLNESIKAMTDDGWIVDQVMPAAWQTIDDIKRVVEYHVTYRKAPSADVPPVP